jgi:hypothetical protein
LVGSAGRLVCLFGLPAFDARVGDPQASLGAGRRRTVVGTGSGDELAEAVDDMPQGLLALPTQQPGRGHGLVPT